MTRVPDVTVVAPDLRKYAAMLRHEGVNMGKEIGGVNRKFAKEIALDIKHVMPKTGGMAGIGSAKSTGLRGKIKKAKKKAGPKHDTRRGAMSATVKAYAGQYDSRVTGGGPRAPHYAVQEFGGGVWWHKGGSKAFGGKTAREKFGHRKASEQMSRAKGQFGGHVIHVRARSPMKGRGVVGWFFFPTAARNLPPLMKAWDSALKRVLEHGLIRAKKS